MMKIVVLSLILSATLFAAHAFPLNEKVIEPAMVRNKGAWGPYVAGYFYYALWLFFPLALFLTYAQ
jgi:hypothetical protein